MGKKSKLSMLYTCDNKDCNEEMIHHFNHDSSKDQQYLALFRTGWTRMMLFDDKKYFCRQCTIDAMHKLL